MTARDEGEPERIRAFVALFPDDAGARSLSDVTERLRPFARDGTWAPREKLHLTLKFVEAFPSAQASSLAAALCEIAATAESPRSGIARIDAFPRIDRARIVVATFDDPEGDLAALSHRVQGAAAQLGIERESRPFTPHVTLARLRRPADARRWTRDAAACVLDGCRWARLCFVRSRLSSAGSVYTTLATFEWGSLARVGSDL